MPGPQTAHGETPTRILVVPRRKLGDLILATSLIRALRQLFPAAAVDVCANDYNASVLVGNPDVSRVVIVQPPRWAAGAARKLIAPLQCFVNILRLRRRRYDLLIFAGGSPRRSTVRMAALIQPRRMACCGKRSDHYENRVDVHLPFEDVEQEHVLDANMELLGAATGHRLPPPDPVLCPNGAAVERYRPLVASLRRPLVAVHISMPSADKRRWPLDRFAELIRSIGDDHRHGLVVIAHGQIDGPLAHQNLDGIQRVVTSVDGRLIGLTDFHELVAILSLCDRLIAHDGAAVHAAAALGKPILGLYVKENVPGFHPWGVKHVLLTGEHAVDEITVPAACEGYSRLVQDLR